MLRFSYHQVIFLNFTYFIVSTLTGISFQNEPIITGGINYLSMAGGSRLMIQGTNMGMMANMNPVLFLTTPAPGVTLKPPSLSCKLISLFLCQKDIF